MTVGIRVGITIEKGNKGGRERMEGSISEKSNHGRNEVEDDRDLHKWGFEGKMRNTKDMNGGERG